MNVVVKVIIDEKEYDRLLEIERKYKEITTHSQSGQAGAGRDDACCCSVSKERENIPLDEIVTRNEEVNAVAKPIPGILPSITTPSSDDVNGKLNRTVTQQKEEERPTIHEGAGPSPKGAQHLKEREREELGIPKFVYPWYYIGAPQE